MHCFSFVCDYLYFEAVLILCPVPTERSDSRGVVFHLVDGQKSPGGGGGDSHMKWTGMLVVSLRGVNFGFWSRLGYSGQNVIIFSRQGLV